MKIGFSFLSFKEGEGGESRGFRGKKEPPGRCFSFFSLSFKETHRRRNIKNNMARILAHRMTRKEKKTSKKLPTVERPRQLGISPRQLGISPRQLGCSKRQLLERARAAGLSLQDYVQKHFDIPKTPQT